MAKFSEHDVGLPGVDIAIKPVRSYVYGALASHILGYVGAPDDIDRQEARKFTFYQGDVEGKSNIEKAMDEYLRGKPGVRYLRRNAKGTIDGILREDPPTQGANVYLTIDARIQSITEEAVRAVGRAAAVVVDPNNGDILAMASVPSFDPNTFHSQHQSERLGSAAEGRGESVDQPRGQRFPSRLDLQDRHFAGRITPRSGENEIHLHRRRFVWRSLFSMLGSGETLHPWDAHVGGRDQSFVQRVLLPIRQRCGNRLDRPGRGIAGLGQAFRARLDGRTTRCVARSRLDEGSLSARKMVAGLHGQRLHRPGLRFSYASPDGDGLFHARQWRHGLLSASGEESFDPGWRPGSG